MMHMRKHCEQEAPRTTSPTSHGNGYGNSWHRSHNFGTVRLRNLASSYWQRRRTLGRCWVMMQWWTKEEVGTRPV